MAPGAGPAMRSYAITGHACHISPLCLESRGAGAQLALSSLKLGRTGRGDGAGGRCLVLLLWGDKLLFEAAFNISDVQQGPLRLDLPAAVLAGGPRVLTAYVALCGPDGLVSDVIDSGQLLALPPEPAAEVRALVASITSEVQQFFGSPGQPLQPLPQQAPEQHHHHHHQQQQQQQQWDQAAGPLLSRAWRSLSAALAPGGGSRSTGRNAEVGQRSQRQWPPPQQQQQEQQQQRQADGSSGGRGGGDVGANGLPDAATLYAYEHFLLPFVRHWAAVLQPPHAADLPLQLAGCGSVHPAGVDAGTAAVRLLKLLLDSEMWACSVLLLDQLPQLAELVAQAGLELPSDYADTAVLERLRMALPPAPRPGPPWATEPCLQQMLDARQLPARYTIMSFHEVGSTPSGSPRNSDDSPLPPGITDESSHESASANEILRQLGALQHARAEQEALEEYLQPPPAPKLPPALARAAELGPATAPEASGGSAASGKAAAGAANAAAPPAAPGGGQPSAAAGVAAAAAAGSDKPPRGAAPGLPPAHWPEQLPEHLPGLLRLALRGFADPAVERSYMVFKSHTCATLDATAGIICSGMLLAATTRSVSFGDAGAAGTLAVLAAYGLFFFLPYIVMQWRRQCFMRWREPLLVAGRCASGLLLVAVALGLVPQPKAWVAAVANTTSMQLQNSFILPSCQQMRVRGAALVAAVHLPSDALMLALAGPLLPALLQSCQMQIIMLTVTLAMDAWCRARFLQRYTGGGSRGLAVAPRAARGDAAPLSAMPPPAAAGMW